MKYFETGEALLKKVRIKSSKTFFDPIVLKDAIGFSVKAKYPDNIKYKPAYKKNGKPDNVAIIWITYQKSKDNESNNKVPIYARISNVALYANKYWDNNYDDPDSPSEQEVFKSSKTPKPIELEFRNDFFYDHKKNHFVDNRNRKLTGNQLLERIFKKHIDTIHPIKGVSLRSKIKIRDNLVSAMNETDKLIKYIILKITGRKYQPDDEYSEYYKGYKRSSFKKVDSVTYNIFNFKAPYGSTAIYYLVILYFLLYKFPFDNNSLTSYIFSNEALFIVLTSLFLFSMDVILFQLLFEALNYLIILRNVVRLWRVKF